MQEIIIREANKNDIPQIINLMNKLFEMESGVEINEENQKRGLELLLSNIQSFVPVALLDNHIVGFCTIQLMISTAEGGYSAWIEDMIIDERYRNFGVGSKIVEFVEIWVIENNIKRIQFLCDENNINAEKFYAKHLFVKTNWKCWQKKFNFG